MVENLLTGAVCVILTVILGWVLLGAVFKGDGQ